MLVARFISLRKEFAEAAAHNSARVVSIVGAAPIFETEGTTMQGNGEGAADSGAAPAAVQGVEELSDLACGLSTAGIVLVAVLTLVIGFSSVADQRLSK